MRAIILAAGRGSRMGNVTDELPKCLVEIDGVSLLQRQINALRQSGIAEIAVVTGYRREMLGSRGDVEFHNDAWASTQMVSSLFCADEWLSQSPCIVSYSDIFFDASGPTSLIGSSSNLALTFDPHWLDLWSSRFEDPLTDAETFRLTANLMLSEIGGRPKSLQEVEGQYMGLLLVRPPAWNAIRRLFFELPAMQQNQLHMTGLLQKLIEGAVEKIECIPYEGVWGEVDSQSDLTFYNAH